MEVAARLQAFLHAQMDHGSGVIRCGPFTVLLAPTGLDDLAPCALPAGPVAGEAAARLDAVRDIFGCLRRTPRIVYVDAFVPDLAGVLERASFVEQQREPLMICTPGSLVSMPGPSGLQIEILTAQSPVEALRAGWDTNEQGFTPGSDRRASAEDVERFRHDLVQGRAFLARLAGEPAAAGMFLAPRAGVTELVGITTLAALRRRGIAAALTAQMAAHAFQCGCDLVFLRPTDAAAARVYARAGFQPSGNLLTSVARRES